MQSFFTKQALIQLCSRVAGELLIEDRIRPESYLYLVLGPLLAVTLTLTLTALTVLTVTELAKQVNASEEHWPCTSERSIEVIVNNRNETK